MSVSATTTSVGLAVAQKIRQTSGTVLTALSTLTGKPPVRKMMKQCPAPMARAFFLAISIRASSLPVRRTRARPDDSQKARPNFMCGRRRDDGLVEVLDRLDEMGLAEDEVHVLGLLDGDDLDVHGTLLSSFGPIIGPAGFAING